MSLLYRAFMITSVVDNLSRLIPKLFLFVVYSYASGMMLLYLLYGIEGIQPSILYDPWKFAKQIYKILVEWWWPQKEHLGPIVLSKIISSFAVPYVIMSHGLTVFKKFFSILWGQITSLFRKNKTAPSSKGSSSHRPSVAQQRKYSSAELKQMKKRILAKAEAKINERLDKLKK